MPSLPNFLTSARPLITREIEGKLRQHANLKYKLAVKVNATRLGEEKTLYFQTRFRALLRASQIAASLDSVAIELEERSESMESIEGSSWVIVGVRSAALVLCKYNPLRGGAGNNVFENSDDDDDDFENSQTQALAIPRAGAARHQGQMCRHYKQLPQKLKRSRSIRNIVCPQGTCFRYTIAAGIQEIEAGQRAQQQQQRQRVTRDA